MNILLINHDLSQLYTLVQLKKRRKFIGRINKEFWDATHNCTAYALGPKQEQQRSSDNGEHLVQLASQC